MRLLECYQKAYIRDKSYTAWLNGQYSNVAHSISLSNAFTKKGTKPQEFPNWQDPMIKLSKPKITKENIEVDFRKKQARQAGWLHHLLHEK